MTSFDAVVVGAGPNGLAAAIVLARAGHSVLVREAAPSIGGGARTEELTLPGYLHDVCSAIHPLAIGSPFFASVPLAEHGLRLVEPPVAVAHPLDGEPPVLVRQDLRATGETLGSDAERYRALFEPLAERWMALADDVLAPPVHWPKHPFLYGRFGLRALLPATTMARTHFREPRTRAAFGGIAAHGMVPLSRPGTASFGLVLAATAHHMGWPVPVGGSWSIITAMAAYLRALGGTIETGAPVRALDELPPARAVILDLTPRQVLRVAGDRLPAGYRRRLEGFRYGPGVFKVDWALSEPVPWRDAECRQAGTVHLAGTLQELAAGEAAVWRGEHPERPFVIVAQQSLFDATRAPAGRQTLWAYCHVPNGSTVDMLPRIEAQIERFAPGFRDVILARHVYTAPQLEAHNANMVGGDIGAGANTLSQVLFRPTPSLNPYATPVPGLFLCSASTPPGGGVHGMCGLHAARAALKSVFGARAPKRAVGSRG